jgi:hypothetical protein
MALPEGFEQVPLEEEGKLTQHVFCGHWFMSFLGKGG